MEQPEDYCDLIWAIHSLFIEGLMTESEFNRLKSISPRCLTTRMCELLAGKGFRVDQITISRLMGNDGKQAVQNENPTLILTPTQKAMHINVIIQNICGFLNLKDIKHCRLINKKWDSVAESLLRKRGKICFYHGKGYDKTCRPKQFDEVFQLSNSSLPFTSFQIKGYKWRRKELSSFFKKHKKNLKELSISDFSMKENGQKVFLFDITLWIQDAPLTKLFLCCDTDKTSIVVPLFKVDLHKISLHLKDLTLDSCVVDVSGMNPDNRCQLTKCILEHSTFSKNGTNLVDYRINDSIDFSQAEVVDLAVDENTKLDMTCIIFDVAENFNIKELSVAFIKFANWATSKSIVDKFMLEDVDILESTKMQIREMEYDVSGKSIDLCALPTSLEKLSFSEQIDVPAQVSCTQPFNLPKLKFLSLDPKRELSVLSHFKNCDNLVEVRSGCLSEVTLDVDWLPKSIKKLSINGQVKIRGGPLEVFSIDTLVLRYCSLHQTAKIIEIISPKILVVNWKRYFDTSDDSVRVVHFLSGRTRPLYIGPFVWVGSEFLTSCLSKYVDKEDEYYRFENGKGTAIDESEFDKLSGPE